LCSSALSCKFGHKFPEVIYAIMCPQTEDGRTDRLTHACIARTENPKDNAFAVYGAHKA